ncbi:MAG: hypothetical protein ACFFE8_10805 [Candidatus Heimdallarchaeota archaeon]
MFSKKDVPNYPQNREEWQNAIYAGIGLSKPEGETRYQSQEFPYSDLEKWIQRSYSRGFHPDFVPALLRNIKGLVAWVYGGRNEPNWSQADKETS